MELYCWIVTEVMAYADRDGNSKKVKSAIVIAVN